MRIWVLLALGQIGDEGGDVFFELSEVHGHVILVELRVLVVLLVASDGKLESRVAELGDHGPDIVADSHHLVLNVVDLALLCLNLLLAIVDLVLQVGLRLFFLLSAHGVHLSMSLELLLDVAVLLFDEVDFAVEHVHVVEKRDVLLLSLDEGGDDLVNRGNTCALLNLFKGVFNDLDVSRVHIHQVLLLFVVVDDLVETDLEQDGRVGEVSDRGGAFFGADVSSARFLSLILVLLLEFLLQVQDAMLEVQFVHVVLRLQGQDLVLGLLRQSVTSLGQVVQLFDSLDNATDLFVEAGVDLVLNGLLLTGCVDLLLELLVLALELVVGVQLLVKLVLTKLDLVRVSLEHHLLDLVLVNVLVHSVFFAGSERGKLIESVRSGLHVEAIKRDTELLTNLRVIDVKHTLGLLLLELLL